MADDVPAASEAQARVAGVLRALYGNSVMLDVAVCESDPRTVFMLEVRTVLEGLRFVVFVEKYGISTSYLGDVHRASMSNGPPGFPVQTQKFMDHLDRPQVVGGVRDVRARDREMTRASGYTSDEGLHHLRKVVLSDKSVEEDEGFDGWLGARALGILFDARKDGPEGAFVVMGDERLWYVNGSGIATKADIKYRRMCRGVHAVLWGSGTLRNWIQSTAGVCAQGMAELDDKSLLAKDFGEYGKLISKTANAGLAGGVSLKRSRLLEDCVAAMFFVLLLAVEEQSARIAHLSVQTHTQAWLSSA